MYGQVGEAAAYPSRPPAPIKELFYSQGICVDLEYGVRFLECLWVEGEARLNFDILIAIEIRRLRLDDIIPCPCDSMLGDSEGGEPFRAWWLGSVGEWRPFFEGERR